MAASARTNCAPSDVLASPAIERFARIERDEAVRRVGLFRAGLTGAHPMPPNGFIGRWLNFQDYLIININ